MNNRKNKILTTTAFILILTISAMMATLPTANALQINLKTVAYLSVNPKTLGLGQEMTVNMWVYPPPSGPSGDTVSTTSTPFYNLTITFTRPDGSKDTFMPMDGSATEGMIPGESEMIGAIWFLYKPNQVGTWTVQFSFPGQIFTNPGQPNTAYFQPATSQTVTFTVQKDPVQIGYQETPLPTDYWTAPVSSNNRQWYQISGDWMQSGYDYANSRFNPYSEAPGSAHIVWKQQVSAGGLIGGDWGSLSFYTSNPTPIIMGGKVYQNTKVGTFSCRDLRTGQKLWEVSGSISLGIHYATQYYSGTSGIRATPALQEFSTAPMAYLWGISSSSWKLYDAFSGNLLQTITNVTTVWSGYRGLAGALAAYWTEGSPIVYLYRLAGWNNTKNLMLDVNELIKWDYSKVTNNNWMSGIVWTANITRPDGLPGPADARGQNSGLAISDDVIVVCANSETIMAAFDAKTGARLWDTTVDYIHSGRGQLGVGGPQLTFDPAEATVYAYDLKTGQELWATQIGEYPWQSDSQIGSYAYGMTYVKSYDGHIYALDGQTGKIVWKSDSAGTTTETPYGTWAFYLGPVIADGKVYVGTSEHSPTQPLMRGNKLFAYDAFTGKEIWNITGAIAPQGVSQGYLLGASETDGFQYCFGKGQTETTVTASPKVIAKGASILIEGTVMDQSPAQPGTPAVSDKSMNDWMNYLHMQLSMPTNVQGVPVKLTAIKPDGTSIDLGTVTSDKAGLFSAMWTPPSDGKYTIVASFAGSESYWSSSAETAVGVTTAPAASTSPSPSASEIPSPTPSQTTAPTSTPSQSVSPTASPTVAPPPPSSEAPSMTLYIALVGAAVVIVVIAATALVLKRRK